ncbi:GNAT family N-acetyltransferase [Salininema proteolyticum]|uniref:GNAT family N-acetyltransferase n=1 Tax=Salininema proteolyticum TaxID=1607685 RepID=A0ABV8U5X7_9ACTN
MRNYAPLNLRVTTPRLELAGATDELLDRLAPSVREGKAMAEPAPFDDPISLYEDDPDLRVAKWIQGVWRGRGRVDAENWRLYFVILHDGEPVGMQDLIGDRFSSFGTVVTFSWLSNDVRGKGLGREMREAVLHLAFDGLAADEAHSDAFTDNKGSNGVSQSLGYKKNGTEWEKRRGETGQIQRWRLTRRNWLPHRRGDIEIHGLDATKAVLGLT